MFFARCEEALPRSRTELRRTALALRRNGVETMEELCLLQRQEPKQLAAFRDVGTKSLALIRAVCADYESAEKN